MKTKKRNKRYTPKYIATNPISTFFGGLSGDHAEHLAVVNITNHGAMAAIVQGNGTKAEFDRIVGAINMGNVLCEQGIGNEFREAMLAGRDALLQVGRRSLKSGRFGFTGDELKAMNEAMLLHDTQLENIRSIDITRAADEVVRRLRHNVNTQFIKEEVRV